MLWRYWCSLTSVIIHAKIRNSRSRLSETGAAAGWWNTDTHGWQMKAKTRINPRWSVLSRTSGHHEAPEPLQRSLPRLIQEIIREDGERSGSSLLPGPPSPPPNLRCQPNGQNQRSLRRCSSPSSEPVLLARGTPCQVSGVKNIAVRFICSSEVVCVVLIYLVSWRFPTFPRMPIHNTQRARVKVCLSGVS